MGKAKAFKTIRKMAQLLPAITGEKMQGFSLSGAELMKYFGISEIKGKPVEENSRYRLSGEKIPVRYQINHEQKMKELYQRFGMHAAVDYAKMVDAAHAEFLAKQQEKQAAVPVQTQTKAL